MKIEGSGSTPKCHGSATLSCTGRYQGFSMKTTIVGVNDSSPGISREVPGLNV
jgi:hypothetical protein